MNGVTRETGSGHDRGALLTRALSRCDTLAAVLLEDGGRVTWADSTAARLFGTEKAQVVGEPLARLLMDAVKADDTPSDFPAELTEWSGTGAAITGTRTIGIGTDESGYRWLEAQMIEAAPGETAVVFYDVTEGVERERSRVRDVARQDHTQHLNSLGDMAAGIADDFNNLLLDILGRTALLLMDLPADSPWRSGLQEIESSALQAGELSNQMLAWSGRIKPVTERLNLTSLVERMDYLLRAALPPGVALHCNCDPRIPEVEADAVQLRQLILGLLSNACEAMAERRGVVTITTGCKRVDESYLDDALTAADVQPGRYVSLELADNGVGIAEDVLPRIFDPFFTTQDSGRGLGLPAALGIVRGHGGAIQVDTAVGKGTTVTVLLPEAVEEPLSQQTETARMNVGGVSGAGAVLVVEEDDNVRQIAERILARFGWQVSGVSRAGAALEKLAADPGIGLVLMDLSLADMTARELATPFGAHIRVYACWRAVVIWIARRCQRYRQTTWLTVTSKSHIRR
jgi:signal transduction histidine kinase